MPVIYRTDGAWGPGKGANLAPAEVDGNFYDIDGRVTSIEDNPVEPVTPIAINIEGSAFTMGLSDGSTLGPIAITMPMPTWRGDWTPTVAYNELDFFIAPDGGLGAVMIPHTSAATFDWGALDTDTGLPIYRQLIGGSGTTSGLADLIDVALAAQVANDMLVWDAAASLWRNKTPAVVVANLPNFGGATGSLAGSKGIVPAPAAGDAAAGKFLGAGGAWVVPATGGGGSTSLAGLSDVSISSPVNLSLLQYHATDGKWHNATLAGLGAGTVTSVDSGAGLAGGPITSAGSLSLAAIPTLTLLANVSGVSATPAGATLSTVLDAVLGTARGSLLRRGATAWTVLAPGSSGQYLQSGGSGADLTWNTPVGAGTVTTVNTGAGLTGGPITSTGTLDLAPIATARLLANVSGSSAAPTATSLSAVLDNALGSGQGQIIYRGAAGWAALGAGTNGYYLQTRGSGADPIWSNVKGGGGAAIAPSLWNASCSYATTAALPACTYANGSAGVGATLTATANAALSVDGVAVAVADRILVKNQATLAQNGAYVVTATGSGAAHFVLTRATDYDQASTEVVQGSAFPITAGATLAATAWVLITGGTITIGTTSLQFEALAATMPVCAPGQVLGNPSGTISAPAVPMNQRDAIQIVASDETTTLTTGAAKVTFRMPYAMALQEVRASLTAASSSGLVTVDINEGGVSILSTKLSIDASERTSTTAATAAVISDAALADDAEMTIDIDAAGTGAKGLKVTLRGVPSWAAAAPAVPTDPSFSSVQLLAHFDGSFVDVSPAARSLTATNTTISTTSPKFGTGSADFSAAGDNANLIVGGAVSGWQFGAGQFTIETWGYFTSTPSGVECIAAQWGSASPPGWMFCMLSGFLSFYYSTTGADSLNVSSPYSPTLNTWIHLAVDRDASNVVRVYADGIVIASGTVASTLYASSLSLRIGNDDNTNRNFPGRLDDVRITKGAARYGGAFTPPIGPFPDA